MLVQVSIVIVTKVSVAGDGAGGGYSYIYKKNKELKYQIATNKKWLPLLFFLISLVLLLIN